MTLAEAQIVRTAILAALPAVYANGVASYSVNGRSITRMSSKQLMDDLARMDNLIARLTNGVMTVAKFRDPE